MSIINNINISVNDRTAFQSIHKSYKYPEKLKKIYNLSGDLCYLLDYFIRKDSNKNTPITKNEKLAIDTNYSVRRIKIFKTQLKKIGLINWEVVNGRCTKVVINYEKMHIDIWNMHKVNDDEIDLDKIREEVRKLGGSLNQDLHLNDHTHSVEKGSMEEIMGINNPNIPKHIGTDSYPLTQVNSTDSYPLTQVNSTDSYPSMVRFRTYEMDETPMNTSVPADVITSLSTNLNLKCDENSLIIQNPLISESTIQPQPTASSPPETPRDSDLTVPLKPKKPTSVKPKFDFEAAYKLYPRKDGKTPGIKKCIKHIKTPQDYEDLIKAINNACERFKDCEKRFIPYFSTFMSSWQDYLEIDDSEANETIDPKIKELEEMLQHGLNNNRNN